MAPEQKPLPPPGARAGGGPGIVAQHDGPRDKHGRRYVGNPDKGCRHCGAVTEEIRDDGAFVVYHPATGCCAGSVRDLIAKTEREYRLYRNLLDKAQTPGNQRRAQELREQLEGLRRQLATFESG